MKTGLLGRTIVAELTAQGHRVLGVSRTGRTCPEAPHTAAIALDLVTATASDLHRLLGRADAVV